MIEIENVTKMYRDLAAVKSVSLSIHNGEHWGVLGHNGSGKSTLLKLMMGLINPSEGSIHIDGKAINNELRKRIGYVSQGESLDSTLNVFENLFFFGLYHGLSFKEARERAKELLSSIDLKANLDSAVEDLSGGTRKKILILRSFMLNPDYLFMDEPSNHLDLHSRIWFNDLSEKMLRSGKTIILTSHDITEVESTCDHTLILFDGIMLACGKTQDLLKEHIKGSVIEYRLDGHPQSHDMELVTKHSGQIIGQRCFLFPEIQHTPEKILEQIQTSSVTVRKPGLKDLYIKLTNRDIA